LADTDTDESNSIVDTYPHALGSIINTLPYTNPFLHAYSHTDQVRTASNPHFDLDPHSAPSDLGR
jgi:hypothetical protein